MKTTTKRSPRKTRRRATPTQSRPIQLADRPADLVLEREFATFRGFAGFNAAGALFNDLPVISTRGHEGIDRMMQDDTLGTCIELKKMAALSTPWAWEAASEDDQTHQQDQHYLTEVFDRLDSAEQDVDGVNVGVVNKLRDKLSALEHGFSITNPVFDVIETGEFAGKYGIADMKTKPPHTFQFETDKYGNILPDGVIQNYTERLPLDQFMIYSYRPRFNNPYGYSDCIRAYDAWNRKVLTQKHDDIYGERHAMGTWEFKEDPNNPPNTSERAVIDSFLKGAQAKSALRHSGKGELKAHEPGPAAGDYWHTKLTRCNIQIARAVFTPDKLGFSAGNESGGAYALGQVHIDMYMMLVLSLQRDIAVQMKRLGRKLIVNSFGPRDKYPNFVFAQMTVEQKAAFITAVCQLTDKGYFDPFDQTVRKKVRELMEFPEEDEAAVAEMQRARDARNKAAMKNQDRLPEDEPDDDEPEEFAMVEDPDRVIDAALAVISANERTVIVGGPKTLKSSIGVLARERFKITLRPADSQLGRVKPQDGESEWSAVSRVVAPWLSEPGRWVIEGTSTARAIRKWLAAHPDGEIPFAVVFLTTPVQGRGKGQVSQAAGVTTVWNEIAPELEARGATVVIV